MRSLCACTYICCTYINRARDAVVARGAHSHDRSSIFFIQMLHIYMFCIYILLNRTGLLLLYHRYICTYEFIYSLCSRFMCTTDEWWWLESLWKVCAACHPSDIIITWAKYLVHVTNIFIIKDVDRARKNLPARTQIMINHIVSSLIFHHRSKSASNKCCDTAYILLSIQKFAK